MGSHLSYKKKNYLNKNEIETLCQTNPYFNAFKKLRNGDGAITIFEFQRITNELLSKSVMKKIMQICSTKIGKFSIDDLKYFYALLYTNNIEAKLQFLLDFIFIKENKLKQESYIKKVNKYFKNSKILLKLFLKDEFITNTKIEREYIYNQIKVNHISIIENFHFLQKKIEKEKKDNTLINNNDDSQGSILILNANVTDCGCMSSRNNNSFNKNNTLVPIKYKQYDKLEREFQNIEKMNNGIFPIKVLENMLKEINVNESLIEVIGNYLRQKTQKTFFEFGLFKELLGILSLPLDDGKVDSKDIANGLFHLFSYPKNYISKKSFFLFVKSTKPELSSQQINNLLNENEIKANIDKDKFTEIIKLVVKELEESFVHISYLQYIFFKGKSPDKKVERNCIEILKKGLSLNDYLKEKINTEDKFYVIDKEFWNKWIEYTDNPKNYKNDIKNLRIFTNKISDKNGKINDGLAYNKDYMVLPKKIYELFTFWYGQPVGPELKRTKIYIDDDNQNKYSKSLSSNFIGEDPITKRKFEIEIFPVFLLFFNFDDLQKKNGSLSAIKESLKSSENSKTSVGRYYSFSRQTKFFDLLKPLEESINTPLEPSKTRLWIYYRERFEKVNFEKKLEEEGIIGNAIIVLEINSGHWPSEKVRKESSKSSNNNSNIGLVNIGNTCYLNSILQTFLNNWELKEIFLTHSSLEETFLDFLINKKTNGKLVKEFINLLKEKWLGEKKSIVPNKFKEICGEYNETFKDFEQQDAYDFYTFLLDSLHEDTNIKCKKTKVNNPERIDTNEDDLGNEYWANNIRNNASYIHGLYLGQLKSILKCNSCKKNKISFERFSSLSLPIPEGNKIILDIILFRLPFTLKPYYHISSRNQINIGIRNNLKKIKVNSIGMYANQNDLSLNSYLDKENNQNYIDKLSTFFFEKEVNYQKMNDKTDMYSSALNINIPLKIKIEVGRKEKCLKISETLRKMKELELEENLEFTYHIIIFNGNYIDDSLIIDDCFTPYQTVCVYEFLNYKGIRKVFDYKDFEEEIPNFLQKEKIQSMINYDITEQRNDLTTEQSDINNISNNSSKSQNEIILDNNEENKEIILPISHRYKKSKFAQGYLIQNSYFENIQTYPDFILLTTKGSIRPYHLYEMIWEKYEYFLNNPTKYENSLWWKGSIQNDISKKNNIPEIKPCSPFVLKILKKNTKSCAFCPWFKFCTGCVLDPHNMNYISFNDDENIIVEWCREVYNKEIHDKNKFLLLTHPSNNIPFGNNFEHEDMHTKVSLIDCLKLFTGEEEVYDIYCENCKKKNVFKKHYEIERLPKYLVLVLKRFKYTKIYTKKIESLITFPLENLDLKDFLCKGKNFPSYDLYSVVNHNGNLSGGHYSCLVKQDNIWVKYDDSFVYENENNIESNSAYMLFYKMKPHKKGDLYFNFMSLIDTAFKLFLKKDNFSHIFNYEFNQNYEIINEFYNDCKYIYGEPVNTNYGRGYLINIIEKENEYYAKVKLEKGYTEVKISSDMNFKETVKIEYNENEEIGKVPNKKKSKKMICDGCFVF